MSTTPKPKSTEDLLGESWIELSNSATMAGIKSPDRITPLPFNNGEEYLRLLREAQRESNQSSRVVSLASSRRDTPRDSPKSPPNSPQSEQCPDDELRHVYINYWTKAGEKQIADNGDWLASFNREIDEQPPKDWKLKRSTEGEDGEEKKKGSGYSIRLKRLGAQSLFSREILYSLLFTNVLSLLLGAGFGLWLSKRGILLTRVVID